jgi:hypothetical protein
MPKLTGPPPAVIVLRGCRAGACLLLLPKHTSVVAVTKREPNPERQLHSTARTHAVTSSWSSAPALHANK